MNKTLKLKTNKFLNIIKLLLAFPVLVILGITAKVISFYYLELLMLTVIFLSILWFYRITYSIKQKVEDGGLTIRVSYNIFNFKFIKISIAQDGKEYSYTSRTQEVTEVFTKPELSLHIEINMDLKAGNEPETFINQDLKKII